MNAKQVSLIVLIAIAPGDVCAQWVQAHGPYGGRVRAFCVTGSSLLAGSQYGGIFTRTKGNTMWNQANTGMPYPSDVRSFAVSDTRVYAGTLGDGVFVSTNNGATWTSASSGITNSYIECLAANGANLVAGVYAGVFVSMDGGASWIKITSGFPTQQVNALAASGSNFVASTYDSVFQSIDNGMNWHSSNAGIEGRRIAAFTSVDSTLYAATDNGVFMSTDHGSSWTARNAGLVGVFVNALVVNGTTIYAGSFGKGVFRSTDQGASWTAPDSGFANATVRALAIAGTDVVAGTNDGVFLSSDHGITWVSANEGLAATLVVSLATSGEILYAGLDEGGVQRSTDNGETWSVVGTGPMTTMTIAALAADGPNIIAGADPGGVFRSTDAGGTWAPVNFGLPDTFYAYCVSVSGTTLLAGSNLGVSRSSNLGENWDPGNRPLQQVVAFTRIGTKIIASAWWDGVFASTDDGVSWRGSGLGLPSGSVGALITRSDRVYIATTDGVYLTTDSARNWTPAGLNQMMPNGFASSGQKLFAGGYHGVSVCTDFKTQWHQVNAGLRSTDVQSLTARDTTLFVGGYGGVWRRPVSEMSNDEDAPVLPPSFSLEQNYPNPFNPTTGIRYQVSGNSWVRLSVFDLLGREVGVLVDERQTSGAYEVRFDGSNLSSGVYFYRLSAGSFTSVRKMTLVK